MKQQLKIKRKLPMTMINERRNKNQMLVVIVKSNKKEKNRIKNQKDRIIESRVIDQEIFQTIKKSNDR